MADDVTEAHRDEAPSPNGKRRKLLAMVLGVFALAGIAYGTYWALVGRYYESTDDAYVNGNLVQITPQVSGTVVAIGADDTEFVSAGKTLVQLDTADTNVALDQAETQLARSVRQVRNLFATSSQLQATVALRETDVAKAREDLARRERLVSSGAVGKEDLEHARDALKSAQAALAVARRQLVAQQVLIDRTTIESHPDVKNAAARVHEAYLAYARTALPAPVSGYVARRSVQLGQRVSPGTPLMAVVPLDRVWIDANFKEGQLRNMRVGQPATVTADLYGSKVKYHGKVVGFGAGTGGAFALLPAQNASGNWIKIVQRVPVRIVLDAQELAAHPLQIGLSMQVSVDIHQRSGERLPRIAQEAPAYQTDVFHSIDELANERVKSIVRANEAAAVRRDKLPHRTGAAPNEAAPAVAAVSAAELR